MGKHSNKEHRNTKKIIIAFIMFFVVAIILSISLYFKNSHELNESNPEEYIKNNINNVFKYLKVSDRKKVDTYTNYNQLIDSLDEMILEENSKDSKEVEKKLFNNLSWNIENVNVKEDTAEASVEVTNKDFKEVMTKWMKNLVYKKSQGEVLDNKLAILELKNVLSEETETKTVAGKIKLSNKTGKWEIELNQDFINIIYPGIDVIQEILNAEINEKGI